MLLEPDYMKDVFPIRWDFNAYLDIHLRLGPSLSGRSSSGGDICSQTDITKTLICP